MFIARGVTPERNAAWFYYSKGVPVENLLSDPQLKFLVSSNLSFLYPPHRWIGVFVLSTFVCLQKTLTLAKEFH